MKSIQAPPVAFDESALVAYVDAGTTTTRVWLMRGDTVLARTRRTFGVRDAAIAGSAAGLAQTLNQLISEACALAPSAGEHERPACVVACGMLGSPQGLAHVPHATAPAGVRDVANAARWFAMPDGGAPILIVPGVRVAVPGQGHSAILQGDVMRGEESLCFGLCLTSRLSPPATVLSLGSHWKSIALDPAGRISASTTTLGGELIHASQQHTLLASSVTQDMPDDLADAWFDEGVAEQQRHGLARALFCVRLLHLANEGTPEQRLAFLVGAFVAADREALLRSGALEGGSRLAIVGRTALAHAWKRALAAKSVNADVIPSEDAEQAILTALRKVWELSRA